MAWLFDEINDYALVTDNSALSLPSGDWSLGGLNRLTDNSGTYYQYFLSWGSLGATPSINSYFVESAIGDGTQNTLRIQINGLAVSSSTTAGLLTAWQHDLLVRSGNTLTMYVNAVSVATLDVTSIGAVDVAANLYLGARSDLNADRFYGGHMAEWAKWDAALNAGERASLANGYSPALVRPAALKWHLPMVRAYQETRVPLTITNNGSVASDHPRIIMPRRRHAIYVPAAASSFQPAWARVASQTQVLGTGVY